MKSIRLPFLRDLCGLIAIAALWSAALFAPLHASTPGFGPNWADYCGDSPLDDTRNPHHPCCEQHVVLPIAQPAPDTSTPLRFAHSAPRPVNGQSRTIARQKQIRAPPL